MPLNRSARRGSLAVTLALLATGCAGGGDSAGSESSTASTSTTSTAAAATSSAGTVPATSPSTTATRRTTVAPTTAGPTTAAPTTVRPSGAGASGLTAITVESTPEQYFVLYVKPDPAGTVEVPVSITKGAAGSTTLTDGRPALSADHYRVATHAVASPADTDGDGVDDLAELADPLANALNPAPKMDARTGAVAVPDAEAYAALSYQGSDVGRDQYLAGVEVMKFIIAGANTAHPSVYFMNTNNYHAHPQFASVVGIPGMRGPGPSPGVMRGDVVYEPDRVAADGTKGVYRFAFQPNDAYAFKDIALAYELLSTSMPFLDGKLAYYAFPTSAYPLYQREKASYDAYRVAVIRGT